MPFASPERTHCGIKYSQHYRDWLSFEQLIRKLPTSGTNSKNSVLDTVADGGGVQISESKLTIGGDWEVKNNTAINDGGESVGS